MGQSVWGLLQHFGVLTSQHNLFAITGTFFNSAPYSGYLATMLPLVMGILFVSANISKKLVSFSSPLWKTVIRYILKSMLVLCVLVIYLASSRAAWLASFTSVLFLIYSFLRHSNTTLRNATNGFVKRTMLQLRLVKLGCVLLVISVITISAWYLYLMRPESANGRLLVWKATLNMIADHPIVGVGAGQFSSRYMHYQASYLSTTTHSFEKILADNNIFAFNDPLRLWAEFGIPGLLVVLGTLLSAFFGRLKVTHSWTAIIARSGLVALLVFSLFSYPASVLPLMVLVVFFLALIAQEQSTHQITISLFPKLFGKILIVMFFCLLILISTVQAFRLTWACKQWKIVTKSTILQGQKEDLEILKEIYPVLKNDGFFTAFYGHRLLLSRKYIEAERMLQQAASLLPTSDVYLDLGECFFYLNKVTVAEQTYRYALKMVPNRAKPIKALALLYLHEGRTQDARCLIEDYLESTIKKNAVGSYQIELELKELYKRTE